MRLLRPPGFLLLVQFERYLQFVVRFFGPAESL
jgi:hypothetical protein